MRHLRAAGLAFALLLIGFAVDDGRAQQTAPPAALLIRGVTLIDGTGRPNLANASVLVEGNKITQISALAIAAPAGAQVIDGRGKFLMPGLIDVHVHLAGGNPNSSAPMTPQQEHTGLLGLHSFLYAGVTTIFDARNQEPFIFGLRAKERAGEIVSPRIFATGGSVTSPGGHGGPYYVESWPQDRAVLDKHLAGKPDMVKIGQDEHGWGTRPMITQLPDDLLEKIIRYYQSKGVRTTIHISNEHNALEAVYAGVDTLAHPVIQSPISQAYVNMMKVKHVPTASTLTIGESYSRLADHPEYLDQPLYRAMIDPATIQRMKTVDSAREKDDRWGAWMKVMTPVAQDNVKRLNAIGKDIIALGTDRSSGADVHRELELLADAGISPADVMVIATRNSARFLGMQDTLGTVEVGKLADLVLLDADPTVDVNNAKQIHTVIKDGRVIDRGSLEMAGVR